MTLAGYFRALHRPFASVWSKGLLCVAVAAMPSHLAVAKAKRQPPLVVIDAGHGGHDPGARSILGRYEHEVTLAIALAVRDRLSRSGKVRVALTRADNRFLSLLERRQFARKLGADLFLSIHADSSSNPNAKGATVYTLSESEAGNVARKLIARPNKGDVIRGADLTAVDSDSEFILFDMSQNMTLVRSSVFANILKEKLNGKSAVRPFHQFAAFAVLKAPDMPSALIETGYLTNQEDAERLFSKESQLSIAREISAAIDTYFSSDSERGYDASTPSPSIAG